MFPTTEAPRSKKTRPALSPCGRVSHFPSTYNGREHPCCMVKILSEVSEKNFENNPGLSPRVADFYYHKRGTKVRTPRVFTLGSWLSPEGRDVTT